MAWLGLDIGGANIKLADRSGYARSVPFPLWQKRDELPRQLNALLSETPAATGLAVTMTGELADCYATKAEGVRHIVESVKQAAGDREVRVYLVDGRFVSTAEASAKPQLAAASNWHALARFAARFVSDGAGVLLDIGSTTTDIIPLVDGMPRPHGLDDTARLMAHELVYCGVGRTPICALTRWLPWRGTDCPIAAEFFASTADAYVVLGELPENSSTTDSADGRPFTFDYSRARLARMLCLDPADFSAEDARQVARYVREVQIDTIASALKKVTLGVSRTVSLAVLSGSGEFLALEIARRLLPSARGISLAKELGSEVSRSAPACAVAVLAEELFGEG